MQVHCSSQNLMFFLKILPHTIKTKKQRWRTSGVLYTQPRRNGGGGTGVAIGTKPRWVRGDDFPQQLFSDIKNLKYSAGAPFECCIHNRVSTTRDAEMGGGQG